MRRTKTIGALALLVASATQSGAGDDAPPLLPPVGTPAPTVSVPAPAAPVAPRPVTRRDTTPPPAPIRPSQPPIGRPRSLFTRPTAPRRDTSAATESTAPSLVPPASLGSGSGSGPGSGLSTTNPPRPLILESVPMSDAEAAQIEKSRSSARPGAGGSTSAKDKPKDSPPTPSRLQRLLGRTPAASLPPSRTRNTPPPDDAITLEPRSDPAADAALKRRLETQAKDAVGTRARSIDVRVVDRHVYIRAKVDRFWNRRPVRKSLESLPGLSGYKATVDVDE